MAIAGYLIIHQLPAGLGMSDALYVAGKSGKLNVITTGFSWQDKYNIWSGIIGGFFLALSYFGTDQSQVGRYLTAKDTKESRYGLLMNGIVKVPMQFVILLMGALLFSFYSFQKAPLYFNEAPYNELKAVAPQKMAVIENSYGKLHRQYEEQAIAIANTKANNRPVTSSMLNELRHTQQSMAALHDTV